MISVVIFAFWWVVLLFFVVLHAFNYPAFPCPQVLERKKVDEGCGQEADPVCSLTGVPGRRWCPLSFLVDTSIQQGAGGFNFIFPMPGSPAEICALSPKINRYSNLLPGDVFMDRVS